MRDQNKSINLHGTGEESLNHPEKPLWENISTDQYFEVTSFISVEEWNSINDNICNSNNNNHEK